MITFQNVRKEYPGGTVAVRDLSLTAPTGKLTVLVGPSGCGKTTSLRMVNRLIAPTSGKITLDGEPTDQMDAALLRRRIGYVIQHAGLFPHLTIVQNIATTARLNGVTKAAALSRAHELMDRVGLSQELADRYPWQLSGGQQQRVGVARALASDPQFLLMDEPFSAVDPVVREQLQDEFLRLQRDIGKTIIMVTHDIDEAMKLGDQVAVLRIGGDLAQIGTPQDLLSRPADDFVSNFIGRDRGYRQLGFAQVDRSIPLSAEPTGRLGMAPAALAELAQDDWLLIVDDAMTPLGWAHVPRLTGPVRSDDLNRAGTITPHDGTMRQFLDAALSSPSGRGVVVDDNGALQGSAGLDVVSAMIARHRAAEAAR